MYSSPDIPKHSEGLKILRKMDRPLSDIGNVVQGRDTKNVFDRLSISPQKRSSNKRDSVVWKPASRISPKKSNNAPLTTAIHETPKRLQSPSFLKDRSFTQSLDRPQFDPKDIVSATPVNKVKPGIPRSVGNPTTSTFMIPISPTKITFSNEKRTGGDGSSSRILSRMRNIRASPVRSVPSTATTIKKRNLTERLRQEEEGENKNNEKRVRFQVPSQPRPGFSQSSSRTPSRDSNESMTNANKHISRERKAPMPVKTSPDARIDQLEDTVRLLEERVKHLEKLLRNR